jgi:hypothetical protein
MKYNNRRSYRHRRNFGKYITSVVKREQLRAAETKEKEQKVYRGGMTHCTLQYDQLLTTIPWGTKPDERLGSEIFLRGFKFNIIANTPVGSSPVWYDFWFIRTSPEFKQSNIASLQFLKDQYDADTYINVKLDKVKVLYHRRLQITPAFSTQSGMKSTKHWERINAKHIFELAKADGSAGVDGLWYNYFILTRAYIVGGTAGTTNCGNMEVDIRTYFKDM